MQRVGAVVLASMVFAVEASAYKMTGKELQQYCGSAVFDYAGGICRGYLEGIVASAGRIDKSGKLRIHADGTWEEGLFGYRWCLPETAKVDEVVKERLAAHPEDGDDHAARLVAQALAETFPCKPAK